MPRHWNVPILIIAGEKGLGKTSLALDIASRLRDEGIAVGGIACPSERGEEGIPMEIRIRELSTGEERPFASRSGYPDGQYISPNLRPGEPDAGAVPPFSFLTESLLWAEEALRRDLQSRPKLMILDEVGPLELRLGSGFHRSLGRLKEAAESGQRVLLTVRPGLAATLAAGFGQGLSSTVELTRENRASLAKIIAEELARL